MHVVNDSDDDFVSPSGSVVLSRGSSTIRSQGGPNILFLESIRKFKVLHYLTSIKTTAKSSSKASTGTGSCRGRPHYQCGVSMESTQKLD